MIAGLKQSGVPEPGTNRYSLTFLRGPRLNSMTPLTRTVIALALSVFCSSALIAQQSTPNPCTLPQQKQLEFWVGEWDLTWPGQNAGETAHGTNTIRRIMDGCVVQENFSGGDSMPLRGTSVSTFDSRSGHWKQTWVDNQGGYLDFVGDFKDGQMILQREAVGPGGAHLQQRMVWKNISATELDWSWESSKDGGKTWQVNWPIHYKRKS
jgi:Protein of unknown function (DUF1579)